MSTAQTKTKPLGNKEKETCHQNRYCSNRTGTKSLMQGFAFKTRLCYP